MRRLLPLLLASILLAAVAAYYFAVDQPARQRQAQAKEAKGKVVSLARDKVTGVELTRGGETLRLERDASGHWWLRAPEVAPARASMVDDLLYAVTALHTERRIEPEGEDLTPYGIDDQAPTIHLTGPGIDTTVRLGTKAPVGYDRTYVAVGGSVAICSTTLGETVKKPMESFLRKRLFDIDRWRARRLEVVDGGRRWSVAKDDHGVWRLDSGVRADADRVDGWLAALDRAEASPLVAGEPPDAAAWAEIRLFTEAGGGAPPEKGKKVEKGEPAAMVRIARGAAGGEDTVAAVQEGLGFWGRLSADTVARLLPDPASLKDLHLVHLHAFDVDRIEVRRGDTHLTLRHRDGAWQGDGGKKVEGKRVDDYLQALEEAEATRYLVANQPPMEGPEISLYQGEKLLASLAFGGEGDTRARRLPDGPTFELTPETFHRLLPTPGRFSAAGEPSPPETSP